MTTSSRQAPATILGLASFAALGWGGLLVPSLVPVIEADFAQTDAGVGVFFLVSSALYILGSVATGVLTGRLGRRRVLAAAAFLMAAGAGLEAAAPAWWLFMAANGAWSFGAGALEVALNGLFLDVFHDDRGRALSRLHLFYSLGALTAPLAVGLLAGVGLPWRLTFLTTSVAVLAIGLCLVAVRAAIPDVAPHPSDSPRPLLAWVPLPLLLLALGIALYVASELGISSWLVRFLDKAPVGVATLALSLYWAGLALGRLVGSRIGDRATAIAVATVCGVASGAALVGGVLAPWLPLSMTLFAVGGVFSGPIYPMIVAAAGDLYSSRATAVSGVLASAAVVGSIIYPPVMGFISGAVGLGVGMVGAGLLAIACAAVLVMARLSVGRAGSGDAAAGPLLPHA